MLTLELLLLGTWQLGSTGTAGDAFQRAPAAGASPETDARLGQLAPQAPPACNQSAPLNTKGWCKGCDYKQALTTTKEACRATCCADSTCKNWIFDTNLTGGELWAPACKPAGGALHGPCCFLKNCDCPWDGTTLNCSLPPVTNCESWGGSITAHAPPACPKATAPVALSVCPGRCDYKQVSAATYAACEAACCADSGCITWEFDTNLTANLRPPACKSAGSGCCFLKNCLVPGCNATCGLKTKPANGCSSWSGASGRQPPPPPPPPPPPHPHPPPPLPPPAWCASPGEQPPCFHNHGTPPAVTKSFDCEVRKHALEFARTTLPGRGEFKTAFDALQLQACGVPVPAEEDVYKAPVFATPTTGVTLYVDASAMPGGDGSEAKPFNTLDIAAVAAGTRKPIGIPKTILLKAGVYHTTGVVLTSAHSNLTIQNLAGADVVISGGVPVLNAKEKWTLHNRLTNTWKLDTKGQQLPAEFGMRVGTKRAIRAKFPNGDPETAPSFCFGPGSGGAESTGVYVNGSGVSMNIPEYFPREHAPANESQEFWAHPTDWPGTFWHGPDVHGQPPSIGGYGPYFYAAGGVCSGRTPPHGYWCAPSNPRASGIPINPPGGFSYGTVLPQAATYTNLTGAIFHARGGLQPYYTFMCLVSGVNVTRGTVNFDPAVGCDQGGPSPIKPGQAWDWYIENVKEECDSPGEYFYDVSEDTLYYTFNGTDAPTGQEEFFLTRTKVLFNITGTMDEPVKNVKIQGLTLRDAAYTYLGTTQADRHWLPSEGDWALQRSGAITIEGAEGVTVHQNQLTRCDGNGVFLGGYTRNVSITGNDLNWIGDSAIAAFGWTSDCLFANCSEKLPAKVGPDGRSGEQPRSTYIGGNLVREYGIWQKQSSAFFEAIATTTTIESNVFFNGPRAAINFNDAFGGGDLVVGNLIFNHVRETVDHGTLNGWERGPYVSDVGYVDDPSTELKPSAAELVAGATPGFKLQQPGSGTSASAGSAVGQYRRLESNFLFGTYNVHANMETDDGSSRYLVYNNYLVYGVAMTDFSLNAHWNYYVNNVNAYVGQALFGWGNWVAGRVSGNPATNCHIYNCTFYVLGENPLCSFINGVEAFGLLNTTMNESIVVLDTNNTSGAKAAAHLEMCPNAGMGITLVPGPAADVMITASGKAVLGKYPKPYGSKQPAD